ncbi:hypothetical protein NN3_55840 [Nocardia neocaledoniensis NBRC 108232]|nr:hypothetical protein NN3_55840 [Nocardia neocaledoniensis NBRC 108232]
MIALDAVRISEECTVDFKNLAGKAMDMAAQHADKVDNVIEKAGDVVDEKTGGKFAGQVDSAQEAAKNAVRNQA